MIKPVNNSFVLIQIWI